MQSPVLTLSMQSKKSLRSFVVYQKKKFAMYGFCANHLKGNGRPSVPGRKIAQVKRLMNNKECRSTQSVSNSVRIFNLEFLILMFNVGTFKFEDVMLVPLIKVFPAKYDHHRKFT